MGAPPVALSIAGSDSCAGAGVQADLKSFADLGVYGICAVTSVVSELPGQVSRIGWVDPALVADQVALMLGHFPVGAMKTGLLPNAPIMQAIEPVLARFPSVPLVVDPVMIATGGDPLMDAAAQDTLESTIIALATLVTPNLDEAAAFWGEPILTESAMHAAGAALSSRWSTAVLIKGGHLRGEEAIDLLFEGGQLVLEMRTRFLPEVATHGTGCTFSAAITAGLARGVGLEEACRGAKGFIQAAIERHHVWTGQDGERLVALNHSVSR